MTAERMPSWEDVVADELCTACHTRPKTARGLCALCHLVTHGELSSAPSLIITTVTPLTDIERQRILRAVRAADADRTFTSGPDRRTAIAVAELRALGYKDADVDAPREHLHPLLSWLIAFSIGASLIAGIIAIASHR